MSIEEYSGILVYLEVGEGGLLKKSLGLLGKARYLAQTLGVIVAGAIFSRGAGISAKEAVAFGADKIYAKETAEFNIKEILDSLYNLINEKKPEIVLFTNSVEARSLAPRLAQRFEVGLGCSCTALEIDTEKRALLMTCPIYEGRMLKEVASTIKRPQIATVADAALAEPIRDDLREGEIIKL